MLSTHHMDEAEILGDRIAIISKGELITCGSFFYLKLRFGKGHILTLARQTQSSTLQRIHSQQHRGELYSAHLVPLLSSTTPICDRLCENRPCSHLVVIRETLV